MKIFQINGVPYGSTGKIMLGIDEVCKASGFETKMACGYSYHPIKELENKYMQIGNIVDKELHIILTKLTGKTCVYSKTATKNLIKRIEEFKPDVLQLHNLHGGFINLALLFKYIKEKGIKVVWTLHDCWAFTGHCPYFTMVECDKWKEGCFNCPQHRMYPATNIDKSSEMYNLKKAWFTGVKDMYIITPSKWLKGLVEQSFLKEYPVKVINNGIDLSVFKPTESDFRKRYGIETKKIILGVSFCWDKRKGIDRIIDLAKRLDEGYQLVLVGTDDKVDKILPNNVLSIHRTQNQKELAEIYSSADVFFNPTREDNFPTVNLEALACGTPIVTFNTGGSPECIADSWGYVVENLDQAMLAINDICEAKKISSDSCVERAKAFDMKEKFLDYVKLYGDI